MANYATVYVQTLLPFIFFYYQDGAYSAYCMAQKITWYGIHQKLFGAIFHGIFIGLFYYWFDMGFKGVVLATGIMFFVRFAVVYLLVTHRNDLTLFDDVSFFSRETTMNLLPLLKKDLSACALGVWGWWSFDICTLMATYLGATVAGGQTIIRVIVLLNFMLPMGFSAGCSINIGKSVGEEKTNLAFTFYKVSLYTGLCVVAV